MNCECNRCNGLGHIDCPDCDGTGELDLRVSPAIQSYDPRYEEYERLRHDEDRVESEAARLMALNPHCAESYADQLRIALAEIQSLMDELLATPPVEYVEKMEHAA